MRSINFPILIRILGVLLLVIALFMLPSLGMALISTNYKLSWAFALSIGIAALLAGASLALIQGKSKYLGPREGFLLVTSGWILVSVIGALPYYLSGHTKSYTDAFFETISGFSTTGASIFSNVEIIPHALLLWRSLTHWLGGMGVIALTVAVLPALGVSGMNLLRAETPGPDVDKFTPRLNDTAKRLWMIYIILTAIQTVLLMIGGMNFFDAINHAFATMATGGFSTKNASLAHWTSPFIHWVVTIFMILAGVNFVVYFRLLSLKFSSLKQNSELKAYFLIFTTASILITLGLFVNGIYPNFFDALRISAFQAASIMTTTGFGIADYTIWPPIAQASIFLLMFVGGSTGSTGGGVKVLRLVAMARLALHEARRMLHPRGVAAIWVNGRPVHKELLYPIAAFIATYMGIALVFTILISAWNIDLVTSFTAVLATLGNIGPGFGAVGPNLNYGGLADPVKWLLSFLMLLGRLELWTVLVVFLPRFWKK